MIEELKPYEAYQRSPGGWPGRVPSHWNLRPAFGAFEPTHERNDGMKERQVLSLSYGRIVIKPPEKLRGLVPESFETYQVVNPGNIVLRTTDLQNDRTSLRVGCVRVRGIITSAYLALKTKVGVQPEYGYQALNAWDISKAIYGYGSGLRQSLDFSHFKRMPVPVPPPEEQEAIVRFLDHANRRIDQFIRAKKKLIALLNEQKQAIVHRAVTRGLDSNARLKAAGVPWLGEIPAHWSLVPNRVLMRIRKKLVGARHHEYQVLSLTKRGVVVRDMDAGGKFSSFWERSQEVRPGDLVFCLFDVEETPRTVGFSSHTGMISGDYTVMEWIGDNRDTAAFVELFYIAMDDRKLLSPMYSGLRKRIPKPEFLSTLTPIPPRDEMQAIVRTVVAASADAERVIERLGREIELLSEYRTRLIADVVTGQFDVRAAAAGLPVVVAETPLTESESDETDIEDGEAA